MLEEWLEPFLDPLSASLVAAELHESVNDVRAPLRYSSLSFSHYLPRGNYHHFATKNGS